ncbi:MAG: ABC transporter substrate-binding protein [Tabrizicola sp.]|jgi:branched-chain amino acid transport system substrate-binding protein|nr:ABC transporter substrate-binding protein [Tabrizicola sp.]
MITRHGLVRSTAAFGLVLSAPGLFPPDVAQGAKIKVGYVSPQTGPLVAFAEADAFILKGFAKVASEKGRPIEVIVKDSQPNPNRAAEVAKELIVDDEVSLILVALPPETTNPLATTCDAEGIPCTRPSRDHDVQLACGVTGRSRVGHLRGDQGLRAKLCRGSGR